MVLGMRTELVLVSMSCLCPQGNQEKPVPSCLLPGFQQQEVGRGQGGCSSCIPLVAGRKSWCWEAEQCALPLAWCQAAPR